MQFIVCYIPDLLYTIHEIQRSIHRLYHLYIKLTALNMFYKSRCSVHIEPSIMQIHSIVNASLNSQCFQIHTGFGKSCIEVFEYFRETRYLFLALRMGGIFSGIKTILISAGSLQHFFSLVVNQARRSGFHDAL